MEQVNCCRSSFSQKWHETNLDSWFPKKLGCSYPWAGFCAAAAAAAKAGCAGQPVVRGSNPAAAWRPGKAEKADGGNCNGSPFLSNILLCQGITLRSWSDCSNTLNSRSLYNSLFAEETHRRNWVVFTFWAWPKSFSHSIFTTSRVGAPSSRWMCLQQPTGTAHLVHGRWRPPKKWRSP